MGDNNHLAIFLSVLALSGVGIYFLSDKSNSSIFGNDDSDSYGTSMKKKGGSFGRSAREDNDESEDEDNDESEDEDDDDEDEDEEDEEVEEEEEEEEEDEDDEESEEDKDEDYETFGNDETQEEPKVSKKISQGKKEKKGKMEKKRSRVTDKSPKSLRKKNGSIKKHSFY